MSGFRHVLILHSNPPTHEPKFVKYFLKSEKVTVLPQPPYSPDLATCDFFFFFVVVSGRDYKSRQSLGSAIVQCISGQPKSASREAFQKWIQRLKPWISNRGENFEGMKCLFDLNAFWDILQYTLQIKQPSYPYIHPKWYIDDIYNGCLNI